MIFVHAVPFLWLFFFVSYLWTQAKPGLPIIFHSFFEALCIIHANSFARFHGINDQARNTTHFCIRPLSFFPLPPQCCNTRQGHHGHRDQQIFWESRHIFNFLTFWLSNQAHLFKTIMASDLSLEPAEKKARLNHISEGLLGKNSKVKCQKNITFNFTLISFCPHPLKKRRKKE